MEQILLEVSNIWQIVVNSNLLLGRSTAFEANSKTANTSIHLNPLSERFSPPTPTIHILPEVQLSDTCGVVDGSLTLISQDVVRLADLREACREDLEPRNRDGRSRRRRSGGDAACAASRRWAGHVVLQVFGAWVEIDHE